MKLKCGIGERGRYVCCQGGKVYGRLGLRRMSKIAFGKMVWSSFMWLLAIDSAWMWNLSIVFTWGPFFVAV
jgi:hypothetical protein